MVKVLKGEADTLTSVNQISMGAIIGAPFMLSTIAFFLIGFSSYLYFKSGRRKSNVINVDKTVLERDLSFFLISFSLAFLAIFLSHTAHVILAVVMMILYLVYLYKTIKEEAGSEFKGEELEENIDPFFLTKFIPNFPPKAGLRPGGSVLRQTPMVEKPSIFLICLQLVFSLGLLLFSAHHFVEVLKEISQRLNFPAFVISLLLTPLATELPEKFNSWMWIRQKKDTLAVGNVSGALVFQSTFPVSIGLLFTSWHITSLISYLTFGFCLISAAIVLFASKKNKLTFKTFLLGGIFYLAYLVFVIFKSTTH